MPSYDYKIRNIWDNEEFLSGATVDYIVDGEWIESEVFVGSMEFAPGYTGLQLATSAAASWFEAMTIPLEERLAPFGQEWQRERYEDEHPF